MRIIFEVDREPFHLLNNHGGALLFVVIASLALVPLASLYVILAVAHSLILSKASCSYSDTVIVALKALQVCSEATLIYALFFPFVLGLFSTHMSYRMMEAATNTIQPSSSDTEEDSSTPRISETELRSQLKENSVRLSLHPQNNHHSTTTTRSLDNNSNGNKATSRMQMLQLILQSASKALNAGKDTAIERIPVDPHGECSICLRQYEDGEEIAWSPNCRHAFHLECIYTWISSWEQAQNQLCPCCRQPFLEEDKFCLPAEEQQFTTSNSWEEISNMLDTGGMTQLLSSA